MSGPDPNPGPFDEAYWAAVERFGRTCDNCGREVKPLAGSSTGWTHSGTWQGVRCPGMLCGAVPAGAPRG